MGQDLPPRKRKGSARVSICKEDSIVQIHALGEKLVFDSEIDLGNRRMRSEIDPTACERDNILLILVVVT